MQECPEGYGPKTGKFCDECGAGLVWPSASGDTVRLRSPEARASVSQTFVLSGQETAQQPERARCSICGRHNRKEDTFDCLGRCGRTHLCLSHFDPERLVCSICATDLKRQEEASNVAPAVEFDWVVIPAGSFEMGDDPTKHQGLHCTEQPQHAVYLPEFRISRVPITVAQFSVFVRATGYELKTRLPAEPKDPTEEVDSSKLHPGTLPYEIEKVHLYFARCLISLIRANCVTRVQVRTMAAALLEETKAIHDNAEIRPAIARMVEKFPELLLGQVSYLIGQFGSINDPVMQLGNRKTRSLSWPCEPNSVPADVVAQHPVTCISWFDAQAFSSWANVRLPTEAEWEKAARGTDNRRWPWGDEAPQVRHGNFSQAVGDTTRVGQYPDGASPYGVLDMAGNVWEWTGSVDAPYPYRMRDGREDPSSTGTQIVRGGSYEFSPNLARCTFRLGIARETRLRNVGFRVVQLDFQARSSKEKEGN